VHAARTPDVTVNHQRPILSPAEGHPAGWNDKTLILFDSFIKGVQHREVLQDTKLLLWEQRSAAWVEWSTTVLARQTVQMLVRVD
jgi:hypothetical protein